jgi:hypothetical protein
VSILTPETWGQNRHLFLKSSFLGTKNEKIRYPKESLAIIASHNILSSSASWLKCMCWFSEILSIGGEKLKILQKKCYGLYMDCIWIVYGLYMDCFFVYLILKSPRWDMISENRDMGSTQDGALNKRVFKSVSWGFFFKYLIFAFLSSSCDP